MRSVLSDKEQTASAPLSDAKLRKILQVAKCFSFYLLSGPKIRCESDYCLGVGFHNTMERQHKEGLIGTVAFI